MRNHETIPSGGGVNDKKCGRVGNHKNEKQRVGHFPARIFQITNRVTL